VPAPLRRRCPSHLYGPPVPCLRCLLADLDDRSGQDGATRPPRCAACGQVRAAGGPCANGWCSRADRSWSVVWSVGDHDGALRDALRDFKYRAVGGWAPVLGTLLAQWLADHACEVEDLDLIVPVPTYTGPGARRSWDPVGTVAANLAASAPLWDVVTGAVAKVAETPAMTGRRRWERGLAAEGALRRALRVEQPDRVAGARVLVLDDVLTAGATLSEVARALRRAGAAEVAGLVLARRGWGPTSRPAGTRPGDGLVPPARSGAAPLGRARRHTP
jgi:predicted amidophosphoribosyltransferase